MILIFNPLILIFWRLYRMYNIIILKVVVVVVVVVFYLSSRDRDRDSDRDNRYVRSSSCIMYRCTSTNSCSSTTTMSSTSYALLPYDYYM